MSTSQSDPENAPPAALVRPELAAEQGLQGRRCSRDAVQNKSEPWPHHHPHVSRSISTSLLTLALAAESEFDPDKTPAPTTFRRPTLPSSAPPRAEREKQSRHDLNVTRSPESSPRKMMVVAPATAGDGRGAGLLAGAPSSPPFPGHDRHDIGSLPTSHRDRFHRSRGRGTSLERTEKERRVQVSPQGAYVNNAGDTALASPPAPRRTPTPSDVIAKNPPTEGVRATYRAWRYPLPGVAAEKAWSIGERGNDSDQGGRVEKLISEAMAGIEPNNRSRKASHSLGFFKEGLPEDRSNKREVRGRGRSKEGLSPAKGSRGLESGKKPGQDTHERDQVQQIRRSDVLADEEHPSSSTVKGARPVSLPPPKQATLSLTSDPANGLSQEEKYFDVSDDVEAIPKEQVRTMPAQLLAEIRKHHNLTPGATKGTSFSRSLPVTESERLKDEDDRQEVKSATSSQKDEESNGDGAELAQVKSTDDEDESGEEQISSALFLPHQSSHDSPERERTVFESVAVPHANDQRHLDASNIQQWLEQYEVPSRDLAKKESNSRAMPMPSPVRVKQPSTYTEKESVVPEPGAVPGVDQEIANDSGYTAGWEDLSDDHELIPVGSLKPESQIPSGQNRQVSDEQQDPKRPLEAIELIPYRHQVGGHTTMWRFSKRAVCKQLSNRENEFYEKVERYHPQLLKFLPRYIGVLNVTLEKQIRRKTSRKDEEAAIERHDSAHDDIGKQLKEVIADAVAEIPPEQTRIVSQSMKHPSLVPIPTVTFADNRHIIPKSFLQPHPHMMDVEHRSKSDGAATTNAQVGVDQLMPLPVEDDSTSSRPTLTGKHANSWGATMINKKLRYQVFGEAFLQQPIPIHRHKKPASQNRSLPARLGGHSLRISSSESNLQVSQQDNDTSPQAEEESIHRKAMKMAAERNGLTPPANNHLGVPILSKGHANVDNRQGSFDSKTGTSAPEPEIASSPKGKRQRRYSSGGLRRKPAEVADDRGNLKYFEEADDAGYKGDVEEDVFSMDLEGTSLSSKSREQGKETSPMNGHITLDSEIHEQIKSEAVLLANPRQQPTHLVVPRPLNPKEAQTQRESRVEYFLLLEDLTAGMRRPCIMDLKMGTRQYGVYANEKKQASQRRKGATTTSHELGVRVCGLQVWDVRTERYIYLDKYFGRNLHVGREFQDALTRFLYDGVDYSSVLRHIPTILRKLSELEVLIRGLVGYRFYAASLLMVYDGDVQGDDESDSAATERDTSKKYEIDFKMADFANSVAKEGFRPDDLPCPPQHPESPDTGFLRGLRSLKKYFFAIQHELLHKEMGRASKSENGENGTGFFSYDDDGYISL